VNKEKLRKIIKKTSRALMWTTGIFVVLLISLYFAFRSPACQTWMSQKAANYLSDELGTHVSIEGVNIQFVSSVVLEGIYIQDLHADTLLYAPSFTVAISNFSYENKYMSVDEVKMTDATIKLKKYKGVRGLNFKFIADYFESTDTTTKPKNPSPWKVDMGALVLDNVRFCFIDTRWADVDRGVDYENIQVNNIFATFDRIEPGDDSTTLMLEHLAAREMSGFEVTDMRSRLVVADTFVKFNDLTIKTPGSDVKGFIGFHFHTFEDIEDDFIHRVRMEGHFSESIVEMGDIAYFSPVMLGIKKRVMVTADVNGTVDRLRIRNADLRFGERSRVAGNFSFNGLPDVDNTDMHLKFRNTTTNRKDLAGIPIAPFNDSSFLEVPERVGLLGDMNFSGSVEGFTHDFVAHGKLSTAQGVLTLDNLAMTYDTIDKDYIWDGALTAEEFNIGTYLGVADMGRVSGNAQVHGWGTRVETLLAKIGGQFSAFDYNGYRYTNITVTDGVLAHEIFNGKLQMHDRNIDLDYNGFVDFSGTYPDLDFIATVKNANLGALNFADTSLHLIVSTTMRFAMRGDDIDNLRGSISFSELDFTKRGTLYHLNELTLISQEQNKQRNLVLLTDFVTASIKGKFEILKLDDAFTDVMSAYLPAYFSPRLTPNSGIKRDENLQDFTFDINFLTKTETVAAFIPELKIAPRTGISGMMRQSDRRFTINASSDSITYGNYQILTLFSQTSAASGQALTATTIKRIQVNDTLGADNVTLSGDAAANVLNSTLKWNNNTAIQNNGSVKTKLSFINQQSMELKVNVAEFHFNDSLWRIKSDNFIRKDSSVYTVNDVIFESGKQRIGVNGLVSNKPTDHLDIILQNFNLASLNFLTSPEGVTLTGSMNADTKLSNLYSQINLVGNSSFSNLIVNKEKIGDGTVDAWYQKEKEAVYVNGKFTKGGKDELTGEVYNNIAFDGYYYPKKEDSTLDFNVDLKKIPLGIIQPLLADFCSLVNGYVAANDVKVTGTLAKPIIDGTADIIIRKVIVDYLGIELTNPRPQPMVISENSFYFDNFKLSDNQRDTCVVYGNLFHDNFKRFQFDMDFAFNNFLVLNTTQAQNEDFYGRVYATGFMNIFGYADEVVSIDITAKTDKVIRNGQTISSDFNIPMTTTSEVGSSEYIQFVNPKDTAGKAISSKPAFNSNGIDLKLNLEATPDAIVHVIFDETVGDELSARGEGPIEMHITPSGEFDMKGRYKVLKGDYLFTLKNIVYAPFQLVEGGEISWNGDPENAAIDMDAIYAANASVLPFFPFDTADARYQQNYPVNVIMHLDSFLMNPALSFDIDLPTADQQIQETVKSYTQSELEMNRQVLSLMVLNSFMTPAEFREGGANSEVGGATSTLLSNFVSGTLNNWLSQISDNANVKLNYRPNEDMSLQELKLYLGTQVWNNRLTFDVAGSVVNASQTQAQGGYNQYVDVNVEYKITEDGKVRARAFNRGNENSAITNGAQHTQGASLMYREDFETFRELMQLIKARVTEPNPNRKQNPAETQPVIPDSTQD
jgi:hypothetical protein